MFRFARRVGGAGLGMTAVANVSVMMRPYVFAEGEIPQEERKCPVAFLWEWGGSKPAIPAGHPIVHTPLEEPVKFNSSHYPKGVNAKFFEGDKDLCANTFCGPNGIFEDVEQREIAKCADSIVKELGNYGLQKGATVADVGAGTGREIIIVLLIVLLLMPCRTYDPQVFCNRRTYGSLVCTRNIASFPIYSKRYEDE